jgi:FdhD protein
MSTRASRTQKQIADSRRKPRIAAIPARPVEVTGVTEWQDGKVSRFEDYLVGEEPLEIRIGTSPINVTMRTPGHDLELASGFLLTESVITGAEQIAALRQVTTGNHKRNAVRVDLVRGVRANPATLQRNFLTSSSCGLCGKASINAVRVRGIVRPNPDLRVSPEVLCVLPEALRSSQALFGRTGGLHAAGLFDTTGKLIALREDVGRHNAVDKLIGWALLEKRLPLDDSLLLVSGRGSFEIVQKALVAGVPVVACISAPSSLAVQLAWEFNLTLVGFLRGKRFVVYTGEARVPMA